MQFLKYKIHIYIIGKSEFTFIIDNIPHNMNFPSKVLE